MKRADLIERIASETAVPQGMVRAVLDKLAEVGVEEITKNYAFGIRGFGSFMVYRTEAYLDDNGKRVPAKFDLEFRPTKAIKSGLGL